MLGKSLLQGEEIEFALSPKATNDLTKSYAQDLIAQLLSSKAQDIFGCDLVLRAGRGKGKSVLFLANGCKVYADEISQPNLAKYRIFEIATPEVSNCRDVVKYDKVVEKIACFAAHLLFENRGIRTECYKTSIAAGLSPGTYTTRGAHESYRVRRDFLEKLDRLIPFLVLRQLFCGQGGYYEHRPVISPRQFFVERTVSDVSIPVPMVCLRNKSLSVDKDYARLQVLNGEGTRSQVSTFLRFALTSLVIRCVEDGFISVVPELKDPIGSSRTISQGCDAKITVRLLDGRLIGAVDFLAEFYLGPIERFVREERLSPEMETAVRIFRDVLTRLAENRLESLTREIEWAIKLDLFEWNLERYFDVDPSMTFAKETANNTYCAVTDPLFDELENELGIGRVLGDEEIDEAIRRPPMFSRAKARVEIAKRFEGSVDEIDWDYIVIGGKKFWLREDVDWNDENIENTVKEIVAGF